MSSIRQAAQAVRQFLDAAIHRSMRERAHFARATGLSMPQFGILMHLHFHDGCGISDIGEQFDVSAPAASQMVEKLVQGGLVERLEDPDDRRARQLALTSRGRAVIQNGAAERYRWLDGIAEALTPSERDSVVKALQALTRAAEQLDRTETR